MMPSRYPRLLHCSIMHHASSSFFSRQIREGVRPIVKAHLDVVTGPAGRNLSHIGVARGLHHGEVLRLEPHRVVLRLDVREAHATATNAHNNPRLSKVNGRATEQAERRGFFSA